mgnify:CR=1 FL=1
MANLVNIDGIQIAYSIAGEGPPVVLLHGWMCNRNFWRDQIEFLSIDHQVIALDFRGHGDSEVPKDGYSLRQLALDVKLLIGRLNLSPSLVVGHSMGGMVAQQLMIDYPEHVSGLVLLATTSTDFEQKLISNQILLETHKSSFHSAFIKYFGYWFVTNSDPKLMKWISQQMLQTSEDVALNLIKDYSNIDFRSHLGDFNIPCLVIGGAEDLSTPPVRSQELAELICGARLEVISEVGHFVQMERPCEVNRILRIFLKDNKF